MRNISLTKILRNKDLKVIIDRMIQSFDFSVYIQEKDGDFLIRPLPDDTSENYRHPIKVDEELIGWVIGNQQSAVIASIISYAVKQEYQKKKLANELLEKYEEIELLHEISNKINVSLYLQEVTQFVIQAAIDFLESTHGLIALLNPETNQLENLAQVGNIYCLKQILTLDNFSLNCFLEKGEGRIINNVTPTGKAEADDLLIQSIMCIPLKTKEDILGVIVVGNETEKNYTTQHLKLLTLLASQAATAIEKAVLYKKSCQATQQAQEQAQQLQQTLDELQHTQAQLVQSEKMSGLGQMVAGIAHEINNPVNFIHGNLKYANDYIKDLLNLIDLYQQHYPEPADEIEKTTEEIDLYFLRKDVPKLLSSMKIGADRIKEIVVSLRNFSRLDQAEKKPVDIHEGIDSTLLILNNRLKANSDREAIQVIKEYGELPPIECYAGALNQVFMNIIANGIDAMEAYNQPQKISTIRISTQVMNPDWVAIRIADNGPGIPEEVMQKIYDPFFTTKAVGKGTGLGMAISYQIVVNKHGGRLKCISPPGQGTEFWIQIPIVSVSFQQSMAPKNTPLFTQV